MMAEEEEREEEGLWGTGCAFLSFHIAIYGVQPWISRADQSALAHQIALRSIRTFPQPPASSAHTQRLPRVCRARMQGGC